MEVFFFLPSGYLRYNLQHQFWAAFSRERHRISGEKEIPQIILQSVHCLSTDLHSKLKYDTYYTCNPNRCMWYHTCKNMSNNNARYWTKRNFLQLYRWMHLLGNESFKLCIGQKINHPYISVELIRDQWNQWGCMDVRSGCTLAFVFKWQGIKICFVTLLIWQSLFL